MATTAPAETRPADLQIVIMAKHPWPGHCKTRLATGIGQRRAAGCYRAMTESVVQQASDWATCPPWLCVAPGTHHEFVHRLTRDYVIRPLRQARGDLGQRMHHAITQALRQSQRVVVLGTDQPIDLAGPLAAVAQRLGHRHDAIMAPTYDGGYWMIGFAHRAPARSFQGIAWSTPRVAGQTRTAFKREQLRWWEPATRDDIDTYGDWQALPVAVRSRLARQAIGPHRATASQF